MAKLLVVFVVLSISIAFVVSERTHVIGQCETYSRPEGSPTASGERFNSTAMTGAHASLAFGTKVLVRTGYIYNIVVINDRPVSNDDKIIQLTTGGARRLILEKHLPCEIDWTPGCCDIPQQFEGLKN